MAKKYIMSAPEYRRKMDTDMEMKEEITMVTKLLMNITGEYDVD